MLCKQKDLPVYTRQCSARVLNEHPPSSQPGCLSTNKLLHSCRIMSNSRLVPTTSSNFQLIFNNALKAYEKRTKKDLLAHPLAAELQDCKSPSKILAVLHQQARGLDQSPSGDDRWIKWLDPTVNVLYMLSETLGEGISLVSHKHELIRDLQSHVYWQVFSPVKVIFAGVGVLLSVRISLDNMRESF